MGEKYQLVFDVGNTRVGVAFFQRDLIVETAHFMNNSLNEGNLESLIKDKEIDIALIGSVHYRIGLFILQFLKKRNIKVAELTTENLSIILDVESPKEVGADRIASTYGALYSHPGCDIIVIDIGTAVVFDVIAKERRFLGGAIAPGPHLSAKVLANNTDLLPLVEIRKPKSPVSKTTQGNIQSGIYYGLLGMIERLVKEIKSLFFGSGNAIVIATGGLSAAPDEPESSVFAKFRSELESDLKTIVDFFEPDLIFFGYHEILKEIFFNKEE